MKDIESSSIVVQWDAVDDFLPTSYIVTWTDGRDLFQIATLIEQTSYTITGLTLDTVYTITFTVANKCGQGPEVQTSISLSTDTTSTITSITPTVTAPISKFKHIASWLHNIEKSNNSLLACMDTFRVLKWLHVI